ncbi:MAG: class I SAM-dependent methyltransferase [Methylotenera sp.]|jgi:ubiquinone/menaquinone biosynthesis C-methylase UbiE|nr:class I SAM-dependent methyltransferase [Methylotenera sp.]
MASTGEGKRKSADEIAEAYKSEPWWYDVRGFFILTFAYNSTLTEQVRLFGSNMGARHLDVACGTATLLDLVLKWRRWKKLPQVDIVGVDYAESMLAGAIRRFKGQPGFRFVHADAADMPFETSEFDTVNIANAIHCLPQVDAALKEMVRVLKPGGTWAGNVLLYPTRRGVLAGIANRINAWGIRKGILVTPYEREDIRARIIAAGLQIVSEEVSGNCYNVIARKP